MTFHPRSGFPFIAGLAAESSCNEIGRLPPIGTPRRLVRAQARRRDGAFPRELDSLQDPDAQAGRGRLGHAY
jgi:hypothetical protein